MTEIGILSMFSFSISFLVTVLIYVVSLGVGLVDGRVSKDTVQQLKIVGNYAKSITVSRDGALYIWDEKSRTFIPLNSDGVKLLSLTGKDK